MPIRSTQSTSTSRSRRLPRRWSGFRRSGPAARPGASGTHLRKSACTPTSRPAPTGRTRAWRRSRAAWRLFRTRETTRSTGTVPIRVAADRRHFEHADGTPFFWLGDTWWMGLCERLKWPDEFHTLAADRKTKGFTVVQIVAGLYPDMPAFDPRGKNEAGFPWTENYGRIRPEYFDQADQRLASSGRSGPCPLRGDGLGLSSALDGRREDEEACPVCDGALRRLACGLVHGRRGEPALLPGEGVSARRGEANRGLGRRDQVRPYASTVSSG